MPKCYCYWRGDLPAITELFFASYLATQDGELHVFLDDCRDPGPLRHRYLQSPRIVVHRMEWARFSSDPVFDGFVRNLGAGRLDRRLFELYCRWNRQAFDVHPQQGRKCSSKVIRLPLWGPVKQPYPLAVYGDLFRCVLCATETDDFLYADMDVCFLRNFAPLFDDGDFVYHWERQPYANSALLFSARGGVLKHAIRELVRRHDTVHPWYLFELSQDLLRGLRILPCAWFDPLWINDAGLTFADFFGATDVFAALGDAFCHHWHNQWRTVPHAGSTYRRLLAGFRAELDAAA